MTIGERNTDMHARARRLVTLDKDGLRAECSETLARTLGARKLSLTRFGVAAAASATEAHHSHTAWLDDWSLDLLRANVPVVARLCKHASSYRVGSYNGKHAVEHALNNYVSNGEFIVAALMLGFTWRNDVPNIEFKMNYCDPRTRETAI